MGCAVQCIALRSVLYRCTVSHRSIIHCPALCSPAHNHQLCLSAQCMHDTNCPSPLRSAPPFLPPAAIMSVVQERELLLREGMRILGLRDGAYWASWFLTHWSSMAVSGTLCALIGLYPFAHSRWGARGLGGWVTGGVGVGRGSCAFGEVHAAARCIWIAQTARKQVLANPLPAPVPVKALLALVLLFVAHTLSPMLTHRLHTIPPILICAALA